MAGPMRSASLMLKLTTRNRLADTLVARAGAGAKAPSNLGEVGFSRLTVGAQEVSATATARYQILIA